MLSAHFWQKSSATVRSKYEYQARLEEIYGAEAAKRLRSAHVTIIGASGTGSPSTHTLARAGVDNFILIDPQSGLTQVRLRQFCL